MTVTIDDIEIKGECRGGVLIGIWVNVQRAEGQVTEYDSIVLEREEAETLHHSMEHALDRLEDTPDPIDVPDLPDEVEEEFYDE